MVIAVRFAHCNKMVPISEINRLLSIAVDAGVLRELAFLDSTVSCSEYQVSSIGVFKVLSTYWENGDDSLLITESIKQITDVTTT